MRNKRLLLSAWWRQGAPRPLTRHLLWALPVVVTIAAVGEVPAAMAQPVAAAPAAKLVCPAVLADEHAALVTARMCGGPVAIAGLMTETDQAVATARGTVEWEHRYRPVRVRQGDGWVPVDTTLVKRADGSVGPVAAAVDMAFSGGGDAPMVSLTAGKKSLKLGSALGALPTPVLAGDTATYPNALAGVDLQLRADVDGYTQVLVVKDRQAAKNPKLARLAFGISGKGLSTKADKAGNLRVVDAAGALVMAGSTPLMWDATAAAARGNARSGSERPAAPKGADTHEAEMPVEVAPEQLTVIPSQPLLDAASTVYPVYIDPGLTVNRAGFSVVSSAAPDTAFWNSADDAFVGSWDSGTSKYRSMFSYDLTGSPMAGKYVASATLNLNQVYAATCQPAQFEVWSTPVPTAQTTWNNQGAWYAQQSTSTTSKGYSPAGVGGASDCPAGTVPMDVTGYMRSAASSGWNGVAFGVRATDESDPNAWKRFSNNPTLNVSYTAYPGIVETMTAPSAPCQTGTSRPYINTLTPLLQARISDPEGALVRPEFAWSTIDGTPVGSVQPTPGQTSGQMQGTTVPAGAFTNGGSYSWKVRGFDGTTWGPWSTACEFTVDTTAPTAAPTVSSTTYPSGTWAGATGTAGTFTLGAAGTTDIVAYVYGLDTEPTTAVNTSSLGANATISLTPGSDGKHVLKVASRDRGGNLSPVTSYTFYVGTGAVLSPTTGAQTAANVTLSGQSKSTATGITYQWRRGNTDTWITIPAADVKTTSGAAITWPVATTGAGAYPNLVWNVAQTVNNAEPGANPLDGPVQVRASLSGSSTGTSTGVSFTLDRDRKEAATTGIGPGAVNLLTGNFTVRTTDAATLGELGLDRTFNSRLAGDMDPLFGPGWTSSFVAVDAGTYTELSVTGTLVQVGLGDGDTLGFTKATSATSGATFTAEVGTGNSTLAYTNSTDSYLLTEPTGDTVTFSRRTGDPVGLYTPTHLQSAGTAASSSISWQKVTVGGVDVVRPTQILAEVPSGVTCTTLVRGCRALKFAYASTTTATTGTPGDYLGRLQKVELTAWDPDLSIPAMRTVALQQYAYDSNGRLASSWDPRLDYTNGAGSLHVATAYTYNTNGTLATLTVPGEQPWTFTYTTIPTDSGAGRLYKATRSALTSGTNVQTVVYNIPISGSSAPVDMAATINRWGQTAVPVDATRVYPGDIVPDGNPATGTLPANTVDDRVTVHYMDAEGREINTMQPGGAVSATFYDAYGNIVRETTASNISRAFHASDSDTSAQEAAIAARESTTSIYSGDGQRLLEMLGPEQDIVLPGWSTVRGRTHTTYTYDEGAPNGGPFNLATTHVESLQYVVSGAVVDTDKRTSTMTYDWTLRQPLSMTVDPTGLALVSRATYDSSTGQPLTVTAPAGSAVATTASTRKFVYYRAGTGSGISDCDNRPEWALLPCLATVGGQPTTGNEIPSTFTTYDIYGQTRTQIEKTASATLRTSTVTYDAAGRSRDTAINSSLGTSIPKQRTVYDQATGYLTGTQSLDSSGNVTASVSRGYDTLGRQVSYIDADGNTSTTTYDLLSRAVTTNDGKATRTFTYNGGGEKRGLATQVVDSQAGTITASYDVDGNVQTETRPDGLTVRHYYNENAQPTGLEYVTDPSCSTANCTLYYDYTGADSHGKTRWDASSFSNAGYGYDNAGRLTGARQDTTTGCALRAYTLSTASNRTQLSSYGPDANGQCQDSNPAVTKTWTYDDADRLTNTGYTYDALGRTLTMPGTDTAAGSNAGNIANTYYTNDLSRTITQGATTATYTLDVLTSRFRSYISNTGGLTVNHVNHYSDDSDSPSWISDGASYTRIIAGLAGLAARYTGSTGSLEWQITNLHGDVVAARTASTAGVTATYITDEYGNSINGTSPKYGYLGAAQRSSDNPGGLMMMGVRLFSPVTGRFLSPDPVYGGNANSYEYCTGDPVNCTDLDGRASWPSPKQINKAEAKRCALHPLECTEYLGISAWAYKIASDAYKKKGEANAYRHCIWQARLTWVFQSQSTAKKWGDAHESSSQGSPADRAESTIDQYNNDWGRRVGQEALNKNFRGSIETRMLAANSFICARCRVLLGAGRLITNGG
jgi:RHS repeat-associated protein